jgi:hypothetical protein
VVECDDVVGRHLDIVSQRADCQEDEGVARHLLLEKNLAFQARFHELNQGRDLKQLVNSESETETISR